MQRAAAVMRTRRTTAPDASNAQLSRRPSRRRGRHRERSLHTFRCCCRAVLGPHFCGLWGPSLRTRPGSSHRDAGTTRAAAPRRAGASSPAAGRACCPPADAAAAAAAAADVPLHSLAPHPVDHGTLTGLMRDVCESSLLYSL